MPDWTRLGTFALIIITLTLLYVMLDNHNNNNNNNNSTSTPSTDHNRPSESIENHRLRTELDNKLEKLNEMKELLNSKYERIAILYQKILEGEVETDDVLADLQLYQLDSGIESSLSFMEKIENEIKSILSNSLTTKPPSTTTGPPQTEYDIAFDPEFLKQVNSWKDTPIQFPDVFRFILLQGEKFDICTYLSIKSVMLHMNSSRIELFYEGDQPKGRLWRKLSDDVHLRPMKFADESASDHVRYASAKALHRLMLAKSFILNKEGGIVMDGCSILGRSIRTQLAMVNISVSIVIPDRTNGELGFELMASKPNQPLWQYLIDKSDTEALSKRFVTHATKLYAFEHPIDVAVLPTEEIFMYDRLAFYQIMRASKQVAINPYSAVLSLGRQFPITFAEIRKRNNAITRFLWQLVDGDEFD